MGPLGDLRNGELEGRRRQDAQRPEDNLSPPQGTHLGGGRQRAGQQNGELGGP